MPQVKQTTEKMIAQTTIIEMGWTKTLIAKFLPEPTLKPNPYYKKAAPMKLWRESDVMEIMQTSEFIEAMEKAAKRKAAAEKAVQTKVNILAQEMERVTASLNVKIVPEESLANRAISAKNLWNEEKANMRNDWFYCPIIASDVDKATLDRWVVNYIRHHLVKYDKALGRMDGRVGKYDIYPDMKKAVLRKIAEVYPSYAEECQRQIDEL